MKNEYIEVVKRWQAGEYFSDEELRANVARAAYTADAASEVSRTSAAAVNAAVTAAAMTAASAANAAHHAARAVYAAANDAARAEHFIQRYEELTNGSF